MELRQLRYVVAVAEELHFGRAAERLHIVQSAVSQQVRRLERELGTDLFDRSPRHVRLTGAGARFLPEARAVLAAADRARAAVAAFAHADAAVLRLGTSTGLGVHLDRVLDAFAALAPDVAVDLVSAPARDRLAMVAAGDLDAAFLRGNWTRAPGTGPSTGEEADGVEVLPLWPDPLLAVLPARHPLAAAPDVALRDLAALPLRLVARRANPPLVDLVVTACHDAGFEPVPGPPGGSLQDSLAAIGTGSAMWTVVYASQAALLNAPRVAFLPFRGDGLALTTGLAVRGDRRSRHLRLLLRAAAPESDRDS
ncbi:LysR family transcriptional regulator [Actinacidiphila rubida]|uniref:DNA-binding transcriptional regulator, LysR family n=1 Tax=Actinacidiphila rubida TaxID=310780 RepID=A0A1H8RF81_9ACTN|nr:LysR family transcriptional regulator [Actinacidiphila rubida]SEO64917.1 DNA-binding transcriptional regulator, LysR family [Actinacidiphila rubida]